MRWRRRPTEPVPPTNVRLVLHDQTEVPVECSYGGIKLGLDTWHIIPPDDLDLRLVQGMTAEVVPAKTVVNFPFIVQVPEQS